jgi:hypothetical protein
MTRRATAGIALLVALGAAGAALAGGTQRAQVELSLRPTSLGALQNALLVGRIASGREGEQVKLQAKPCGMPAYQTFSQIRTTGGGTFRREYGPGINASVRAVWKGSASAPVAVRQAPRLQLDQRGPTRFEIGVGSLGWMWRKKVSIQRRQGSSWATIKRVAVTDTYHSPGSGSGTWTEAEFSVTVPAGSTLRAVLPASEAKPCYLRGVSNTLRT